MEDSFCVEFEGKKVILEKFGEMPVNNIHLVKTISLCAD